MFQSLKDKILSLPEEEQLHRRAFYSDEEWERSWELNAYPHQLPPMGEWKIWTVIGGPRVGCSTAGAWWALDRIEQGHNVLALSGMWEGVHNIMETVSSVLQAQGSTKLYLREWDSTYGDGRIRNIHSNAHIRAMPFSRNLRGLNYKHVWADDVRDANNILQEVPMADQYVFTRPDKLHPQTIVSRAGDGRSY